MNNFDKYTLRPNILDRAPELEITKNKFEKIKTARKTLNAALAIEEKYEILYCNHIEYEQDLLSSALNSMSRFDFGYDKAFHTITTFNRRIINILTSARMYTDQMIGHLRDCLPTEDDLTIKSFFKQQTSEQYDSNFEYSLMEALRNHVQHSGLCVSRIKSDNRIYEDDGGGSLWENRTLIYCSKKLLSQNPHFKSTVYNTMPDEVELTTAIRKYIGCISEIHNSVRNKIETSVETARFLLENTLNEYRSISDGQFKFTHANPISGDSSSPLEVIPVFLDWDDIRVELQHKNIRRPSMSKHYVSSRTDNTTITPRTPK